MKKTDSPITLSWQVGFTLQLPASHTRRSTIATRLLIGACLLSFALGVVPLIGLLLAVP